MSDDNIKVFNRPFENCFAEGNIIEQPIFKLSNKEARPTRANGLLAKEDYRVEYVVSENARVIVEADMHHGFPTIFALRVLLLVLDKARRLGFQTRHVPISRAEIARGLGYQQYGGRQYALIREALRSLLGVRVHFFSTWREPNGEIKTETARSLITAYQFGDHPGGGVTGVDLGIGQLSFEFYEYVDIEDGLFESFRSGYRIAVDLDYLNKLQSPTAQRLYLYLTKKDSDRASYCEGLLSLGRKLPLACTTPSQIRRIVEPALLELQARQANGKRFLESHAFERSGRETKLIVGFAGLGLRASVHQLANRPPAAP